MPITFGTIAAGYGILFAAHAVNEAIVDRVPLLRNVCRGETQKSIASVVANSVSDTIKDEFAKLHQEKTVECKPECVKV